MAIPADQWNKIREKLKSLSPDELDKVTDFAEFLQSGPEPEKEVPSFKWAGALSHLKDKYTSVELEDEIRKIRTEGH